MTPMPRPSLWPWYVAIAVICGLSGIALAYGITHPANVPTGRPYIERPGMMSQVPTLPVKP